MKTLIIVDMQNDFVTGSLATDPTEAYVARTADWLRENAANYDQIVVTKDWHQTAATEHIQQWGEHCMAETPGAELHPLIADALTGVEYTTFLKGQYGHGYSGFEGTHAETHSSLLNKLRRNDIDPDRDTVEIIGIATDFCVRATALDAVGYGFITVVLRDYVNAVDADAGRALLNGGFQDQGVEVR